MQTSLHILSLVHELKIQIVGARVVSTEFYKKERSAYVIFKGAKTRLALGLIYRPTGYGCFLIPASKIDIDTREKPWPIFELTDFVVESVEQFGLDRVFGITLVNAGNRQRLVYETMGPNGNIWLLDQKRGRRGSLRKRIFDPGQTYMPAKLPDRINPFELSALKLKSSWQQEDQPLVQMLQKGVLGFDRVLAKESVCRAGLSDGPVTEATDEDAEQVAEAVRGVADSFLSPEKGYLHELPKGFYAAPMKLVGNGGDPVKYKSLSLAVQAASQMRRTVVEQVDEKRGTIDMVNRALKRLEKRNQKVSQDIEQAANYDRYRRIAELLQINFDRLRRGMDSIEVENPYNDPPTAETIELDSALSPQENIGRYARRYRKGRDGLALLTRRFEVGQAELEQLRLIRQDLEANFEAACQQYRSDLDSLRPREKGVRQDAGPRLPYREHLLSSGVRILVGRDGTDNDRTTFEYAKPYELWFHTQQCPGSHVVIKYPNKKFEPSRQEIEEAAAVAAWHSKARNDTMVPVIYTERRYVRKPRKAKPGLVTVEREKSVMVEPRPPEKTPD